MRIYTKSTGGKENMKKYLEQVDRKNHLLFFSSLDQDTHFADNIIDETVALLEKVEPRLKTILYTYVFTVNSKYDCINFFARFNTRSL